jgi:hypothetical protein
MGRDTAYWYRRGRGVLVGEGRVALVTALNVANRALELLGKQQGMFIDRHELGQPNEFANWTDEELRQYVYGNKLDSRSC